MNTDNFTREAKQAISLATLEAERRNQQYAGTEHILLALLADAGTAKLLTDCGIKLEAVQLAIESVIGQAGEPVGQTEAELTVRARRAIELAQYQACLVGSRYCGPEHLLLGVIREEDDMGGMILGTLGGELLYNKLKASCSSLTAPDKSP